MERIPHANPHKVTWLNRKQHFLVGEKAWVEFTIGRYKDKVLYEILPMDACHHLLGSPWQFDIEAMHDRTKNAYSF